MTIGAPAGGDHSSSCVEERLKAEQQLIYDAFERLERGEEVDLEGVFGSVPGIILKAISWQELLQIVANGSEAALGRLGRTPLDTKTYYDYRDAVIRPMFASITDYLYVKVFNVGTKLGNDGKKVAVLLPDFNSELRIVWRANDFPYSFEEGIEHHNVWANRPLTKVELEKVIADNRQGYETAYYINPPSLMSIPTIWHAHVISRRLRDTGSS